MNWPLVAGTLFTLLILSLLHQFGHAHLRLIPMHVIGNNRLALWLYALVMLPGTLLHEASHAVAAFILNVEVKAISVSPAVVEDWVVLGYVQHGRIDALRHAVVGVAPLIIGTVAILLVCALAFNMPAVYQQIETGNWPEAIATLARGFETWRGWLAAYATFVISSSMFPSPSDRRGWAPIGLFFIVLLILPAVVGIDLSFLSWLVRPLNIMFQWLLIIFVFALVVDFVFILLLTATHQAIAGQFPEP
jgi:hypothetical protein